MSAQTILHRCELLKHQCQRLMDLVERPRVDDRAFVNRLPAIAKDVAYEIQLIVNGDRDNED